MAASLSKKDCLSLRSIGSGSGLGGSVEQNESGTIIFKRDEDDPRIPVAEFEGDVIFHYPSPDFNQSKSSTQIIEDLKKLNDNSTQISTDLETLIKKTVKLDTSGNVERAINFRKMVTLLYGFELYRSRNGSGMLNSDVIFDFFMKNIELDKKVIGENNKDLGKHVNIKNTPYFEKGFLFPEMESSNVKKVWSAQ